MMQINHPNEKSQRLFGFVMSKIVISLTLFCGH